MASMSTTLLIAGGAILAFCAGAYYGLLEQYIGPLKNSLGSLYTVMLAAFAIVGVFLFAFGMLYRQMD